MVVRDHSGTRKVGEIIKGISTNEKAKGVIDEAAKNVPFVGPSGVISTVVDIIGSLLASKKDTILESIQGSLILTPERRKENYLEDKVSYRLTAKEYDVVELKEVA